MLYNYNKKYIRFIIYYIIRKDIEMSEVENTNVTSVKEMDYLDEDKPIRGQNYVLLSFLSPEDVLVNKEAYMFNQFITKFSNDMTTLLDGIQSKYSDSKDFVDSIKENNSYIFNPKDMSEQYAFYKSINNHDLESSFHRDNNFMTSIRGIKVRGVFDSLEEAKNRSEFIKRIDDKFNIYIAQVGCWCPWSPNPESLENQEYAETQLNTLMKEYKKNMNDKDVVFENRKTTLFNNNKDTETIVDEVPPSSDPSSETDLSIAPESIEMSEIKQSIEQVDTWSAQKLGIQ
jgi:hypothetical protein